MGKPSEFLNSSEAPSPEEITMMLRLAKTKLQSDFKKTLNPEKKRNYELELGLFQADELGQAAQSFAAGIANGQSLACAGRSLEDCTESALTAGLLVGEVTDGDFGWKQFQQFYATLTLKKEFDKRKAKGDVIRDRKKSGMGRFYGQATAILGGLGDFIQNGVQAIASFSQAIVRGIGASFSGNWDGTHEAMKETGDYLNKAKSSALYSITGMVDFNLFLGDLVNEAGGMLINELSFKTKVVSMGMLDFGTFKTDHSDLNRSIAAGYEELADNREKYMSEEHRVYSRNANYLYKNDQVSDAIVTTGLAACTAIPNPASPGCFTGLVAYKTARGAYEGGVVGAGAALGSAALTSTMRSTGFGVNFGYSYANGYSAGINYGIPGQTTGIQGGVGYSQRNGWNAKIGYGFKNGVNLSYDHSEFGGDTYTGTLANNYGGAFLNYNTENGYSGGINVTSNGSIFGNPLGAFSTLGYGNSGVYNDVSYFVPEKAPMTEAEREQAAESARNNLLNNILGGIGYVAGRVGDFAKEVWDTASKFVSSLWNGESQGEHDSWIMPVFKDNPKGFGLDEAMPKNYDPSKGETGWTLAYGAEGKNIVGYVQELKNGIVNEISERTINGQARTYVNGTLLEHGDGMTMDQDGKLTVIKKADLVNYIKEHGITNAVVSTNGIGNSGVDAAQMFQSIARHVNILDAKEGGETREVIHLFRDRQVSNAVSPNLNDRIISSSLTALIDARAFSTGGAIIGHSAGARTIENGIRDAGVFAIIKADVITLGGANNNALNAQVKSWTDIMHKQDLVTGNTWGTKNYDTSIDNYKAITTNFQDTNNKDWKTHSYMGTYREEFLQYYVRNW